VGELEFIDLQIQQIQTKLLENTGMDSYSINTGHGQHTEKVESNDKLRAALDDLYFRRSQLTGDGGFISVQVGGN
jgi:hypothetical protein